MVPTNERLHRALLLPPIKINPGPAGSTAASSSLADIQCTKEAAGCGCTAASTDGSCASLRLPTSSLCLEAAGCSAHAPNMTTFSSVHYLYKYLLGFVCRFSRSIAESTTNDGLA